MSAHHQQHLVELSEMIGGRRTMRGTSAFTLSVSAINTWSRHFAFAFPASLYLLDLAFWLTILSLCHNPTIPWSWALHGRITSISNITTLTTLILMALVGCTKARRFLGKLKKKDLALIGCPVRFLDVSDSQDERWSLLVQLHVESWIT